MSSSYTTSRAVQRDLLVEPNIVIYRLMRMDYTALDWWNDSILRDLHNWTETNGTLCLLYDISSNGVSLALMAYNQRQLQNLGVTPGGTQTVIHVLEDRPTLKVRLAILLSNQISGAITYRRSHPTKHPQIESEYFFNEDRALEWLRTGL